MSTTVFIFINHVTLFPYRLSSLCQALGVSVEVEDGKKFATLKLPLPSQPSQKMQTSLKNILTKNR
jgi:hypothetical protein